MAAHVEYQYLASDLILLVSGIYNTPCPAEQVNACIIYIYIDSSF